MTPEIVQLPALSLVGCAARFISANSPDANNMAVIPPLWGRLMSRRGELPLPPDALAYGACRGLPPAQRSRDDELEYLAGFNVGREFVVPEGMVRWEVRAQTYARFVHRGPISRFTETVQFVFRDWLPNAPYMMDEGADLEIYDARFRGDDPASELDYLIPVRAKA